MRPRSPRSLRLRALRAAIAALAVLLVAGGPIAGVAHYLLVAHVVCEHGDLVELTAEPGATTPVVDQSPAPAVSAGRSALFGPDHVHCGVAALARHAASHAGVGAAPMARVPAPRLLVVVAPSLVPAAFPLLALAPKTSPPRA